MILPSQQFLLSTVCTNILKPVPVYFCIQKQFAPKAFSWYYNIFIQKNQEVWKEKLLIFPDIKGAAGKDKLSTIYTVLPFAAQQHIAGRFHFLAAPFYFL